MDIKGKSKTVISKLRLLEAKSLLFFLIILGLVTACEPLETGPDDPGEDENAAAAFQVYEMAILVENNAPVLSKENSGYLNCTISVDGKSVLKDYQGTGRIRGRGNSSWL